MRSVLGYLAVTFKSEVTYLAFTAIRPLDVPNNISFRDVTFTDLLLSVQINVETDVACHLNCRLTTVKPKIHLKSGVRRGYPFIEDLRFCFVSYEDNEQLEPGDTFIHTWVKPAWGLCTTKWCYFWGLVSGVVSASTSPPFEHHNSRTDLPLTFHQLILEPWTHTLPPPPVFYLLILEPWTDYAPSMHQLFLEPWTS